MNAEKRFVFRFAILADRVVRAVARMYGPKYGLRPSTWKTMAAIGRHGKLAAKDVCAHATIDPDKVTRAVDRLVNLGFAERRRDEIDGRRVVLSLTPRGAAAFREIERLSRNVEIELRGALSSRENAELDRLLRKLESRAKPLLGPPDAWRRISKGA